MTTSADTAATLLDVCRRRGWTLACAESLTGGGVCAQLTEVAGASDVVRGAIVAYHTDLKASLLGVSRERLETTGPVDQVVAEEMALGVAKKLHADVGLATTGVAGPGPADGHEAGTVHIAVTAPNGAAHQQLALEGDRDAVRQQTVARVIQLALELVGSSNR
ncbi:MAG: CinA family protein [Actinomycetaceae bacterium]|nr:CinA family protein [Actinomycetaceae bacterium]MDU0970017.1 CinA family protein [Actinomycetaceae bacterium]